MKITLYSKKAYFIKRKLQRMKGFEVEKSTENTFSPPLILNLVNEPLKLAAKTISLRLQLGYLNP